MVSGHSDSLEDNGMECELFDGQLQAMEDCPSTKTSYISKRFILLITCLCALCDCLLMSVIGKKTYISVNCSYYEEIFSGLRKAQDRGGVGRQ